MAEAPPVASPIPAAVLAADEQLTLEQIENFKALPDSFKKGYKTTEFWQSTVATLLPVAAFGAAIFGVDIDAEVLAMSLAGIIPQIGYIFSRTWLKRKRIDGLTGGNLN
jgi:hypothetical protein